jgi:hypothetical protein
MTKFLLLALSAASPLLLSACASSDGAPMDTGERLSQRGGAISDYGASWTNGEKDFRQGQRLVERSGKDSSDAEKRLARAREQVASAEAQIRSAQVERSSGERMMADGTAQMQRAEADYTAVRTGQPVIVSD